MNDTVYNNTEVDFLSDLFFTLQANSIFLFSFSCIRINSNNKDAMVVVGVKFTSRLEIRQADVYFFPCQILLSTHSFKQTSPFPGLWRANHSMGQVWYDDLWSRYEKVTRFTVFICGHFRCFAILQLHPGLQNFNAYF